MARTKDKINSYKYVFYYYIAPFIPSFVDAKFLSLAFPQQGLGDAEGTLAEKLIKLNKTNPLLLILLGAIGAGILLALLVVSAFAIHKQKNLRLEGGHGKVRKRWGVLWVESSGDCV